jgi:ABC-type uncharacterized transport system permease subunit
MDIALSLAGATTPVLYALAAASYAVLFARGEPIARRVATPLLRAAIVLHLAELILRGAVRGRLPISNVFESLSALAFALACVYLIIEWSQRTPMTGVFVLPLVALAETISSAFVDHVGPAPEILRSALFAVHAGAAILGYCGFAVAAIYGILFLALYHELKSRRFSLVFDRLPPLEVLARMNITALAVGFAFLSVAILFGAVWVSRVRDASIADPKILMTGVAWALFGFSLFAHFVLRWGGPRVIYISVAGFLLLVTSSVAVNFVGDSFHVFH